MTTFTRLIIATLVVLFGATASAQAEWRVTRVKQPAFYLVGSKTWKPIKRGLRLPRRSWIRTGRGGRVKLNRGSESIRFSPNSLAAVQRRYGSRMTQVRQRSGSVDISVRKRNRPHMTVRNRYMTAVVKGTTFRVSTRRRGGRVSVRSGLVAVRSARGGKMDVGRGQYAAVSRSGAMSGTGRVKGRVARAKRKVYSGSVPDVARPTTISAPAAPRVTISGSGTNASGARSGGGNRGAD